MGRHEARVRSTIPDGATSDACSTPRWGDVGAPRDDCFHTMTQDEGGDAIIFRCPIHMPCKFPRQDDQCS